MPATATDPAALHRLAATLAGLYPNRTWADAVRGAAEEIERLRAELAEVRRPRCDACGYPLTAAGLCSRSQCYNAD